MHVYVNFAKLHANLTRIIPNHNPFEFARWHNWAGLGCSHIYIWRMNELMKIRIPIQCSLGSRYVYREGGGGVATYIFLNFIYRKGFGFSFFYFLKSAENFFIVICSMMHGMHKKYTSQIGKKCIILDKINFWNI